MSGSAATDPQTLEREQEFLLKEQAVDSLASFAELCDPKYRAAAFHELLARTLQDCFLRKKKRICISVPPRHGKSKTTSVMFPAWALTKNPALEIIQAGYTAELSEEFSVQTKAVLKSPRYLRFFKPVIDPNHDTMKLWKTLGGGAYFATGVGGGGVGRGADIFIVDDPFKNRQEANSATKREDVWNWFNSTAMTRLSPDGVMIVIQTRWHEDDLIGRLTNPKTKKEFEDAGIEDEVFDVISLEATCENPAKDPLGRKMGEALWPERWTPAKLAARKLRIGNYEWNSQYQQRPNPPGGNLCDVKKVKRIARNEVPPDMELVRGWDLAISEAQTADYSVGVYGGCRTIQKEMPDGSKVTLNQLFIVHIDRNKRAWPEQKRTIINYATNVDRVGRIGVEAVRGWEVADQELRETLKGRSIVKGYKPATDKVTRALPWLACIDAENLFIVEGDWNQDFLDELEQFPNCTHDDQVDATTVLWEMTHKKKTLLVA